MGMIYGHKWISSFSEKDDGTWLAGLSDVTPEEIGGGITKCLHSQAMWPPTLNEFRNCCVGHEIGLTHRTAAYKHFDRSKALECKPNKKKAMSQIEKMKLILN